MPMPPFRRAMTAAWHGLWRQVRPPAPCPLCQAWTTAGLCPPCGARFVPAVPRCPTCALPLSGSQAVCGHCLRLAPPMVRTVSALDYQGPWPMLIRRWKFDGAVELSGLLADLLHGAVQRASPDGAPTHLGAILPVPLSAGRLRERGYNQSWELARRLAARLGVPAHPALLRRWRDTPAQAQLDAAARASNLRDAFTVEPGGAALLAGRHVALVDDVMTTGATVAAATRALLGQGAGSVEVWVLARTPEPEGPTPTR